MIRRLAVRRLAAVAFLVLLMLGPALAARADDYDTEISAIDNAFDAGIVRIQPGQIGRMVERREQPAHRHGERRFLRFRQPGARGDVREGVRSAGRVLVLLQVPRGAGRGHDRDRGGGRRRDPECDGRWGEPGPRTVAGRVRGDGAGAGGLSERAGGGGSRRTRRHGLDRPRRVPRVGGRHDAIHHDQRRGPQPNDPRREGPAPERHPRDRGRWRVRREPDDAALRLERRAMVDRVRLPRVVRDRVRQRRLRHLRVRFAVRAVRPLVRGRIAGLRLLHRAVRSLPRVDHRFARGDTTPWGTPGRTPGATWRS